MIVADAWPLLATLLAGRAGFIIRKSEVHARRIRHCLGIVTAAMNRLTVAVLLLLWAHRQRCDRAGNVAAIAK